MDDTEKAKLREHYIMNDGLIKDSKYLSKHGLILPEFYDEVHALDMEFDYGRKLSI
jgi:hypothetical protein